MTPYRVLIVDNHVLVRAGFRALLQSLDNMEVLAEASNGREALQLVERYRPDLLLMDIAMPEMNGIETTARITKEFPAVRVIMLSMHADQEYVHRALQAGAMGYVLKDGDLNELELAIRAVLNGDSYLSPAIAQQISNSDRPMAGDDVPPPRKLTARQREILQLIAEGKSTKEIASLLFISAKTVETHRAQLMERLNIHDVPGLVRYAIRTGSVILEE